MKQWLLLGNSSGKYIDANVSREVGFDSPWCVAEFDGDDQANDMHEAVVEELRLKLLKGYRPPAALVIDEDWLCAILTKP
jgi:hypothetical protein